MQATHHNTQTNPGIAKSFFSRFYIRLKFFIVTGFVFANPFETRTIQLLKGDTIYSFTDGFADQFGGPKGKKLMYRKFEELLLMGCTSPLEEQKEALRQSFAEWKGNLEQIDAVCVIGIRI